MKTMKKCFAIIGAASLLAAPNLFATIGDGNVVLTQGPYSYINGGEFTATGDAALNGYVHWDSYAGNTAVRNQSFQTFCVELNEEFYPGQQYNVSAITDGAEYNAGLNKVHLTEGVAYLYSQFAAGTLANYDYTGNRSATAGELQLAIWTLLGEEPTTVLDSWATTALQGLNQADWFTRAAPGFDGVSVMILGDPGAHQDQLIMTGSSGGPNGGTPVPEPSTIFAGALMLLPLGVSALRIVRKNRAA